MGFTWKIEDLKLREEKLTQGMNFTVFEAESKLSRDEKIAFIDSQTGGQMSELLRLSNKFQTEKDTIKTDRKGNYNMASLKAWYKNNINTLDWSEYDLKFYGIFKGRIIYNLKLRSSYDIYIDIVDQAFHNLLENLWYKEIQYFKEHDEYTVLMTKLEQSRVFSLLGFNYWVGVNGIGKTVKGKYLPYTIEELRYLTNVCDKFEEKINEKATKIRADFKKNFPNKKEI